MEDLASYALTEPGAGSDAAALTTRAVREGDGWALTGVKQFISGAGAAQVYVVMARTGGEGAEGISAFLVDKDDPGVTFGPERTEDGVERPAHPPGDPGRRAPARRPAARPGGRGASGSP